MKKTISQGDPENYYRNRKALGERAAALIRSGNAKPLTKDAIQSRLAAAKKSQPITIRLMVADIELAKERAEKKGLGYQTYLKSLLHEALHADGV